MPSSGLAHRALSDPRLDIYRCGRMDIRRGQIDRRVLATMNFLADNGFRLEIDSLRCGTQGPDTSDSEHSSGNAMTISKVDGIPTAGHQGQGSAVDSLIKTVLGQQGVMEPNRVTSHENLPGPVSTSVSGKQGDHVDIGFTPLTGSGYQSPFPHAIKGRIDMGVDYVGQGPINAIGNAQDPADRRARLAQRRRRPGRAGGALQAARRPRSRAASSTSTRAFAPPSRPETRWSRASRSRPSTRAARSRSASLTPPGSPLAHDTYTEGKVTAWGRKMDDFLSSVRCAGQARPPVRPDALAPGVEPRDPADAAHLEPDRAVRIPLRAAGGAAHERPERPHRPRQVATRSGSSSPLGRPARPRRSSAARRSATTKKPTTRRSSSPVLWRSCIVPSVSTIRSPFLTGLAPLSSSSLTAAADEELRLLRGVGVLAEPLSRRDGEVDEAGVVGAAAPVGEVPAHPFGVVRARRLQVRGLHIVNVQWRIHPGPPLRLSFASSARPADPRIWPSPAQAKYFWSPPRIELDADRRDEQPAELGEDRHRASERLTRLAITR